MLDAAISLSVGIRRMVEGLGDVIKFRNICPEWRGIWKRNARRHLYGKAERKEIRNSCKWWKHR